MADGGYVQPGSEYSRDSRYISTRITDDGRDGYPVESRRYRLVVSRACPWANRSIIVRRLLGLEDVLSMGVAGPTHDERSWTFDLDPSGWDRPPTKPSPPTTPHSLPEPVCSAGRSNLICRCGRNARATAMA